MVSSKVVSADRAAFKGASCAFGVFDGVHEGHRFIIGQAVTHGRDRGEPAVIITFDKDPFEVFMPDAHDKLMTNDERISALADLGADEVAIIPFDRAVAGLEPQAFLDDLFDQGAPEALFVGEDVRFGRDALGTVADLESWGASHGMTVHGTALLEVDGAPVTATRIRSLLREGDVHEAMKLLGHPYEIEGEVVAGRQAGREMGICTANLNVSPSRIVLADGVYAAYALVDGVRYQAAVSIGVPVTFDDAVKSTIEAHLLGFDADIYGKRLTLEFMERLRPMIKFASTEALIAQINEDIERTRQILWPLAQGLSGAGRSAPLGGKSCRRPI